ncbi:MAG: hypothetical protein ACJAS4_001831 [Bacteriovoracaceae bacterium]|jgi:hypothetical protein
MASIHSERDYQPKQKKEGLIMRAIIDIFLAIIFSVILGSGSMQLLNYQMKKESLIKVQKGLSSLENFTKKLTQK